MLLRYFLVDSDDQLRLAPHEAVEDVWQGRRTIGAFDWPVGDELRIVSVLCDEDDLSPKMCFFLKADLQEREVTDDSRHAAYDAMTAHNRHRHDTTAAALQFAGWPRDWQTQLAVALDVPALELSRIGVGGPLLMADLWGYSIDRILDYFQEASD